MPEPETVPQGPNPQPTPLAERARLRAGPPVMTSALIGANLVMAAVQLAAGGGRLDGSLGTTLGDWALGAKVPSLIAHGEYWRLVTANFLHGSVWHLVVNLVGLLVLGRLIELFYGRARMFVLFVLSCVTGTVLSYLITQSVSLGASTGIMGLMGALLVHNARYRRFLPDRLNAVYPFLLVLVVVQFWVDLDASRGVDVAGHLGGLLGGIAVGALLEGRVAGSLQDERDWLPLPTALATAIGLLLYGGLGLLVSLPTSVALLRAARAEAPASKTGFLERVVSDRPYFLEARVELMHSRLVLGDLAAARADYQEMLRQDPYFRSTPMGALASENLARALMRHSFIAYGRHDYEQALQDARETLALVPPSEILAGASNQFAWILVDKLNRDLDAAEKQIGVALKLEPDSSAMIDTLAWIYYKQKRYPEALTQQLQALARMKAEGPAAVRESSGEIYYHLGAIQEKLGKLQDARAAYVQAVARRAEDPGAREGLERLTPKPVVSPPSRPLPPLDPAEERGII